MFNECAPWIILASLYTKVTAFTAPTFPKNFDATNTKGGVDKSNGSKIIDFMNLAKMFVSSKLLFELA